MRVFLRMWNRGDRAPTQRQVHRGQSLSILQDPEVHRRGRGRGHRRVRVRRIWTRVLLCLKLAPPDQELRLHGLQGAEARGPQKRAEGPSVRGQWTRDRVQGLLRLWTRDLRRVAFIIEDRRPRVRGLQDAEVPPTGPGHAARLALSLGDRGDITQERVEDAGAARYRSERYSSPTGRPRGRR